MGDKKRSWFVDERAAKCAVEVVFYVRERDTKGHTMRRLPVAAYACSPPPPPFLPSLCERRMIRSRQEVCSCEVRLTSDFWCRGYPTYDPA